MGIDAEMFVRIRGRDKWLSDEQIKRLAYELSSSVGYENFLLTENLILGGGARRALYEIKPFGDEYGDYPDLIGKVVYLQDGPPVVAADDEQFIRVSLMGRYYGEGYERGDWPTLRLIAEWLEARLPGEVWYGGDSSGVLAIHLDAAERKSLTEHWILNGHRPYRRDMTIAFNGTRSPDCPLCEVPMVGGGGGPNMDFWCCDGCGKKATAHRDGRIAWAERGNTYPRFHPDGSIEQRRDGFV